MYYENKIKILEDIFGERVSLGEHHLRVGRKIYPIKNDVIILNKNRYNDVQLSFGREWALYNSILEEHFDEYLTYFADKVNSLRGKRLCDLGCGSGRYSYYLSNIAKEIILVDFSDAIFVARENMRKYDNCLFFMGDLRELPFKNDFVDFIYCLGVLHHLPTPCLYELRGLRRLAPEILAYIYYKPPESKLFDIATFMRLRLCKIKNETFRKLFALFGTYFIYLPLIWLGRINQKVPSWLGRFNRKIPLYKTYKNKSPKRIKQDVYDRFFTPIEQRVSTEDIFSLDDIFHITLFTERPYWHFLCKRRDNA